jgi:histidine triad (HIT) family protein
MHLDKAILRPGAPPGGSMSVTIFTRIIRGEIPCHKVYEDDRVFAFLDINPLSEGHTLVIPKEEAATLDQLSEESAAALGRALPRIARAVMKATGTSAYNVLQNNGASAHQAVFHVHFHIIPKQPDGAGLGIGWQTHKLDGARGADLAARIAAALS